MANQLLMAKTPAEAAGSKTDASLFLAGGTEVNHLGSDAAESCETLISLKKCSGLSDVKVDGERVCIGAMVTFQQIIESDDIPEFLKDAALFMASRTKRNMATIGGNIAARRSDSYIIPALIASGAVVGLLAADGAACDVPVEEYISDPEAYKAALITYAAVPKIDEVISKRYANTAQSHAVLTMSAAKLGGSIRMAGAIKNYGIVRFTDLEKEFNDDADTSEEKIVEMVRECTGLELSDDMFGSDAYKRYLIAVTAFDMYKKLAGKEV